MSYNTIMGTIKDLVESVNEADATGATVLVELDGKGDGYVLEITYRKLKPEDFEETS